MTYEKRRGPARPDRGALEFVCDQANEQFPNTCPSECGTGPKKIGRPPRPRPREFSLAYVELGADALPDVFRAHKRTIRRWLGEAGPDELRAARRKFVQWQREIRRSDPPRRAR
jgi:hypothetical protein